MILSLLLWKNESPNTIQFREDYKKPDWIRLENNKLVADLIPDTLTESVTLNVVIKNKPGGESFIAKLRLHVVD